MRISQVFATNRDEIRENNYKIIKEKRGGRLCYNQPHRT